MVVGLLKETDPRSHAVVSENREIHPVDSINKLLLIKNGDSHEKTTFWIISISALLSSLQLTIFFESVGIIIFTIFNLTPLFYLCSRIPTQSSSMYQRKSSQFNGIIVGSILYMLVNILFNVNMWNVINKGGPGTSTAVIAYLYLPILGFIMVIIGYFFGYVLTYSKRDLSRIPKGCLEALVLLFKEKKVGENGRETGGKPGSDTN